MPKKEMSTLTLSLPLPQQCPPYPFISSSTPTTSTSPPYSTPSSPTPPSPPSSPAPASTRGHSPRRPPHRPPLTLLSTSSPYANAVLPHCPNTTSRTSSSNCPCPRSGTTATTPTDCFVRCSAGTIRGQMRSITNRHRSL